jgi:hypothetical protein
VDSDSRSDDAYGREVRRLLEETIREELAIAAGMERVDLGTASLPADDQ